jgi:hypothetical protein
MQGNSGEEIFNDLVKYNDNIFMVVCGHIHNEALNVATNASGGKVYEILNDYQELPTGGDGWLRTLRFEPDQNKIYVESYSPVLDQYNLNNGDYILRYDMGGPPLDPIPLNLNAHWNFNTDGSDPVGGNDLTLLAGASISDGKLHLTNSVTNGYATAPSSSDLDVDYQFSVALWLEYNDDTGVYSRVVARQQNENYGFNIGIEPGADDTGLLIIRIEHEGVYYNTSLDERLPMGEEHHLAFAFDDLTDGDGGDKITAWLDGEIVNVTDNGAGGSVQGDPVSGELFLGIGTSSGSSFSGTIDDLRFYEGLLTQWDVEDAIMPYLPGDANRDGIVNASDATVLAGNWQAGPNATWLMGDFNGDGYVNASDATILAGNWQANIGSDAVPEPGTWALLLTLLLIGAASRIRRQSTLI